MVHDCGGQFFYFQAFKILSEPSPKKCVHQKHQPGCKLYAAIIITQSIYSLLSLIKDFWPINLVDAGASSWNQRKLKVGGGLSQEERDNIKHEYFLFHSRVRGIFTHLSCKSWQNYSLPGFRPLYYLQQENRLCFAWGFLFACLFVVLGFVVLPAKQISINKSIRPSYSQNFLRKSIVFPIMVAFQTLILPLSSPTQVSLQASKRWFP